MKNVFLYMILMLIGGVSFAQESTQSLADSLRDAGNLPAAIKEYARIYNNDPGNKKNAYNFAGALALDMQIDSSFRYLMIGVETDTAVTALTDPDFIYLIDDPRWGMLESQLIERTEAKYGKYKNIELSKELWKMRLKDQAYYYHISIAGKIPGYGSLLTRPLWDLKAKINQENVKRLEEIIAEYGFPKESFVKVSAAEAVFLIIQHADLEVQKKYLPMMREAADNGEANWAYLALMIDRVNLREGKMQVYGSQIYRYDDGTYYVKDLEEPEYVNQRRAEVGLGPIEEYVKQWGIEWKVEQMEK